MTRIFAPALAFLLLATTAASGQIVRTFDVAAGGQFLLDSERGEVEVRSRDGNTVRVEVRRGNDAADEILDAFNIAFSISGNEVRVDARDRRWWNRWGLWQRSLRFIVEVPTIFDVDVRTAGGSVEIGELRGEVRARTAGGGLTIGPIDGPVWGRTAGGRIHLDAATSTDLVTAGGSITIGEVDGPVRARTSGGSIHVERGSAVDARTAGGSIQVEHATGSVDAETLGGSVRVTFDAAPLRDSRLSTSGGSVMVTVPETAAFNLNARGGRVTSDLPVAGNARSASRGRLKGTVNGGGPELALRSTGGSVSIRTR